MGLTKDLTEGQDIEVDVEGNKKFEQLRVISHSWGTSTVLADKEKYFKKKTEGAEYPEIDVIFLNSEGYELDSKKRIIPLKTLSTENRKYTLVHGGGKYAEAQSILEQA